MAEGRWVKLYQKMLDDPAFSNSTPAQFKVLITVLLLVTWTPYKWDVLGREFTLQPGEVFISTRDLADRARVTRQSVRSSLVRFEKLGFLTHKATHNGHLIHIVNWEKYQGNRAEANPQGNPRPTQDQPTGHPRPTQDQPNNNQEDKKIRRLEDKKGAPPSLLKILNSFETHHQTPELTAALVEWADMRRANGNPVSDKDLPELLRQLMEISGGDIARAIAIVRQSTGRKWNRFWELKQPAASIQPVRYPKPPRELPKGIPPPRPEDFPGDPVAFQEAMNGWAMLHGEENKAIKNRFNEPNEEEKAKILQSMDGKSYGGGKYGTENS